MLKAQLVVSIFVFTALIVTPRALDVPEDLCLLEHGSMQVIKSPSTIVLSERVGKYVLEAFKQFEDSPRDRFTIALSGGSLPKLLAQGLLKHKAEIDFSKWHVFFADERYVPSDHEDSNFKACFDAFLKDVPIPEGNIVKLDHSLPLEESAKVYAQHLSANLAMSSFGLPQFELILLGMGPDGHTCSLFPGHPLLKEDKVMVAPIKDSPKPPPERITLTFPILNNARNVFFLAAGGGKAEIIPKVLISEEELAKQGDAALPSARVRPQEGKVLWFIDDAAAANL